MPDSQPQRPQSSGSPGNPLAQGRTSDDGAALLLGGARLADGRKVDVRLAGAADRGGRHRRQSRGRAAPCYRSRRLSAATRPRGTARPRLHGVLRGVGRAGRIREGRGPAARHGSGADPARPRRHGVALACAHGELHGLDALEAVLQAGRSLRGLTDLSVVAVPRVLTGTAGVGGPCPPARRRDDGRIRRRRLPRCDPDPGGYVEAVLQVAVRARLSGRSAHTRKRSRPAHPPRGGGRRVAPGVTIGPCGGLGRLRKVAARAAERLAAAGVSVVCLPQGGCADADAVGPSGADGGGSGAHPWATCATARRRLIRPRSSGPYPRRGAAPPRYNRCVPPGYGSPRAAALCATWRTRSAAVTRWRPRTFWPHGRAASRGRLRHGVRGGACGAGAARGPGGGGLSRRVAGRAGPAPCGSAVARLQPDCGAPGAGGCRTSAVREFCDSAARWPCPAGRPS